MAVTGTLYTYPENWRAFKALIAAQYSGAKLRVLSSPPHFHFGQTNRSPDFLRKFPVGKVPAFEGDDGFCVFESNAIAYYGDGAGEGGGAAGPGRAGRPPALPNLPGGRARLPGRHQRGLRPALALQAGTAPKNPQNAPKHTKNPAPDNPGGSRAPKREPRGPKMGLMALKGAAWTRNPNSQPQNAPKMPQNTPKMFQSTPKKCPEYPRWVLYP
uniref:GST N-terminal domain-containing protein n=1 Tax=Anas zonorhyncha TaxID=75864 RepID=A0A8B9U8B0_9AVES